MESIENDENIEPKGKSGGGYAIIPNGIARSPDVSPGAFRLFAFLASFNPCYPSYEVIRRRCGLGSNTTVSQYLKALVSRGLIEYDKGTLRIGGKNAFANSYRICARYRDGRSDEQVWQSGYVEVPNVICQNPGISSSAIRLYAFLKSHMSPCNQTYNEIRRGTGMGPNSIHRAIRELHGMGVLDYMSGGSAGSNVYRFPPEQAWSLPPGTTENGQGTLSEVYGKKPTSKSNTSYSKGQVKDFQRELTKRDRSRRRTKPSHLSEGELSRVRQFKDEVHYWLKRSEESDYGDELSGVGNVIACARQTTGFVLTPGEFESYLASNQCGNWHFREQLKVEYQAAYDPTVVGESERLEHFFRDGI